MIYVDFYREEDRPEKYILTKNININALCLYYQIRNTFKSPNTRIQSEKWT